VKRAFPLLLPFVLVPGFAHACLGPELATKMNAVSQASKAAFANHPEENGARQERVQAIVSRNASGLKNGAGGAHAIDALCSEYDELLAVYK